MNEQGLAPLAAISNLPIYSSHGQYCKGKAKPCPEVVTGP